MLPGHTQESSERYDPDCLPLKQGARYGPFDYNKAPQDQRELVEARHFNEIYRTYLAGKDRSKLIYGDVVSSPAAEFSYTLWAFPNHARALAAMEDLAIKHKSDTPPGAQLRIHCYFQRAVRFTPEDPLVRSLYGYYYARREKKEEAMAQLAKAEALNSGIIDVAVYSAFAYFEIKEFDKSLAAAKQAYTLGYQLPGLRNKLERAGKWHD
ncbi:MAG: hypothetical protein FWF20_02695 [Betaproteobacteria bacterium]|nr:hypothetical protein [Betaproteobacteria bacterium]